VNDTSESYLGCDVGPHGGERPPAAEDLAVRKAARQARLARGQWTDAGAGLQVRLA
jgi:hypothetical protein